MSMLDDFDALFEPKDDKPWLDPTSTAYMDGIRTEEDYLERYNAYAQCVTCFAWTYIIGSHESYGNITHGATCEECGGHSFDPHSVTSKRSWNPETAKRRRPKGIKKKK